MQNEMNNIIQICVAGIKNISYIPIFLVGLPIHNFGILLGFIIADMFTGVIKSYILMGGRSITSRRFSVGLMSKLLLLLIPLILAHSGSAVGIDLTFVATGALSMLILSEAYSIMGNIVAIHTGKEYKEFDAVTFVLKRIQKTLEKLIKE